MTEQFLAPSLQPEEDDLDAPSARGRLDEFVGQERIKEQLDIALQAARGRDESLDHVLLVGPPGLGKTSLAYIVREELGVGIRCVAGPAIERKGDLAAILTTLEPRDVLFIDEIHRLSTRGRGGALPGARGLPARHHGRPGPRGADAHARGAAVHARRRDHADGLLTTPLRDRFGMTFRLEYYEPAELGVIVRRSAGIMASRSRTTRPRRSRAVPRYAAHGEPDAAARARRGRGAPRGCRHARGRAPRLWTCSRSTARARATPTAGCSGRS